MRVPWSAKNDRVASESVVDLGCAQASADDDDRLGFRLYLTLYPRLCRQRLQQAQSCSRAARFPHLAYAQHLGALGDGHRE